MKHVKKAYHKTKSHVKEHKNKYSVLFILILIAIPIWVSYDLRSTPAELPIADKWAEDSIRSNLQAQVMPEINSQYPLMSSADKQKLARERANQFITENRAQFDTQIATSGEGLRQQFQDANGQTYLVALDPYYYFRFARNILDHGYAGEYLNEDGKSATKLIRAPEERVFEAKDFHTRFSVFWHKFLNIFKDLPLETTFFYMPVLFMCLATIPAFFIGNKLGGSIGGFFAALFTAIHPSILPRTIGGFADTDAYNIFFPLLIAWLVIEAIESKDKIKQSILGALTGIVLAIYSTAWVGWTIFVFLLIGTLIASFTIVLIKQFFVNHKNIKKAIASKEAKFEVDTLIYVAGSCLIALLIVLLIVGTSPMALINTLVSASDGASSLEAATTGVNTWPNILTTVAELNNANFNQVVSSAGGGGQYAQGVFFIAMLGIILLIFRKFDKKAPLKSLQFDYAILFFLWVAGTTYMSFTGVRFILLTAPAIAVLTGISLGLIAKLLGTILEKTLEIPKFTAVIVVLILGAILFQPIMVNAENISQNTVPSMNDQFYNTLKKIGDNSQPDAIISSWWDFGHQFITISERGATADGGSQGNAVFLGVALAEDNPAQFARISDMLNCGNNQGIFTLNEEIQDMTDSVHILYEILKVETDDAIQILVDNGIEQTKAEEIISYTHCDEQVESFWIASEDMIGKAPVWGHFGLWDFDKAKAWTLRKTPEFESYVTQTFNMTSQEALQLKTQLLGMSEDAGAAWISPWPRYYTGQIGCQVNPDTNTTFICPTNLQISQDTRIVAIGYDPVAQTAQLGVVSGANRQIAIPEVITTVNNGTFISKEQVNSSISLGISFFPNADGTAYSAMVMDPQLTDSMFNRMFFYNAIGLEDYMEKFDDVRTVTGQRIITYKRK